MTFYPPFRYTTGDELSALLKATPIPAPASSSKPELLVIDVRDDDFEGGNIKGAQNIPSTQFQEEVANLVHKAKDARVVVFHCLLSQARGPKAARVYADTRKELNSDGKLGEQQVLVLRGGFQEFQAKFFNDPELVENWDKSVWSSMYDFSHLNTR